MRLCLCDALKVNISRPLAACLKQLCAGIGRRGCKIRYGCAGGGGVLYYNYKIGKVSRIQRLILLRLDTGSRIREK